MRKLLGALAVCAALLVPASPALASPIPAACSAYAHDQVTLGASRTWLTGASGCSSGYPIQYNRTACIYRNVIGTFWYDGPTRTGNGSSTSNYSGVTCNQYPYPSVVQVWIFYNFGLGWGDKRLF